MLRSSVKRGGGGGIIDKMIPGYQDKIWAALPQGVREYKVRSENDAFESAIASHKKWQGTLLSYKETEKGFAPSQKYRKPAVDWRRQMERGTMHYGRWYEGPNGSDYRPGNTVDRLENVHAPFSEAEWAERKEYRSWDLMKFGYAGLGIFLLYRLTNEWPVVWCDDKKGADPMEIRKTLFASGGLMDVKGYFTLVGPGVGRFAHAEPVHFEYFTLRGLGQVTQLCLEVAGYPYHYTVMGGDHFVENRKKSSPLGALPIVTTSDGCQIAQSKAVVAYVAKVCGLAGESPSEEAACRMLAEQFDSEGKVTPADIDNIVSANLTVSNAACFFETTRGDRVDFDDAKKALIALKFWEDHLARSRVKGSGFVLGGIGDGRFSKVCYVDIQIYWALRTKKEALIKAGCINLARLIEDVEALDGVQRLYTSGRLMPAVSRRYQYEEDDLVKKP